MICRLIKQWLWVLIGLAIALVSFPAFATVDSMGEAGIDARRLHQPPYNLLGRKIAIGQVEVGRPARFGLDKAATENRVVRPAQLLYRDGQAQANDFVDEHAANVAGIMVSQDKSVPGVAPEAALYSSAVGLEQGGEQPEECLSTQAVALQNSDDIRAINFSFGESLQRDPREEAALDGNALLTQCVDWSARVHNTLYVIAGNQGRGGIPIPTDNFNGMTVANSMLRDGVFRKVNFYSLGSDPRVVIGRNPETESNVGPRRSVSLVAPGDRLATLNPDGAVSGPSTGTSFAAPHVTATVALLQEYGDASIRRALERPENAPIRSRWTLNARQHEVMKAVLMNAADKIKDDGDGLRLGMTRTLLDLEEKNWLESDAYTDEAIPLNAETGTGHLNAFRAYEQFSPGQWGPDAPVPAIGWDYRIVAERGTEDVPRFQDYVIEQPLEEGSFISATLAWNRLVELQDTNQNKLYDLDETFEDKGLNNLDVYLMEADEDDTDDSIWSSSSEVDSVEHIFHQIPETGQYKLRVVYRDRVNEAVQPYALAWWAAPAR
jgi:hypothetical protein